MAPHRQQRPPRRQAAPPQRRAPVSSYGGITILAKDRCGTLCLLCRIPAIFAPAPAMLGDSSARLSFRTTLHGGGGGGGGGGQDLAQRTFVFGEERSIVEAFCKSVPHNFVQDCSWFKKPSSRHKAQLLRSSSRSISDTIIRRVQTPHQYLALTNVTRKNVGSSKHLRPHFLAFDVILVYG